jgi:hypothetical protein
MNRYDGDGTGRGSTELSEALDRSLVLLERGRTPEDCLDRFPEHAEDLQPLLEVAAQLRRVPIPTPSPTRGANGKQRMLEALAQKKAARGGLGARLRDWRDTLLEAGAEPAIDVQRLLRSAAAAAAVVVLIAVGAAAIRSWRGMTVQQEAVLTSQRGLVEVLPLGADEWVSISEAMLVQAGDRIRTGAGGSAQLTFFDGSITALRPEAELSIARMTSRRSGGDKVIVLHQWLGEAYNQVQPLIDEDSRFSVETASAVVSVRGTAFTLTVEPDGGTRLEVHEGTIEVRTRETSLVVSGGEEIRVEPPLATATPTPAPTPEPTATPVPPSPDDLPSVIPPWTDSLTETPEPSELDSLQPTEEIEPALEESPPPPPRGEPDEPQESSDETEEPAPTKRTPPGHTNTPEPPGHTKTPQPPGQDKPPEPDADGGDDNDDDNNGGGGPPGGGPPGKNK